MQVLFTAVTECGKYFTSLKSLDIKSSHWCFEINGEKARAAVDDLATKCKMLLECELGALSSLEFPCEVSKELG